LKSILDPAFGYVPSIETDVRKTFERIRREQQEQLRTTSNCGAGTNVRQLRAGTNGMSRASGEVQGGKSLFVSGHRGLPAVR